MDIAVVTVVFFIGELLLSQLFYRLHLAQSALRGACACGPSADHLNKSPVGFIVMLSGAS
jgi:hypothetical protein